MKHERWHDINMDSETRNTLSLGNFLNSFARTKPLVGGSYVDLMFKSAKSILLSSSVEISSATDVRTNKASQALTDKVLSKSMIKDFYHIACRG